ncbi:MAG TPA: hypothetical protein VLX92_28685 [Kofleriaceae bacterium]|nr:hypothetical protein [Kofleriaceae bacterium]
MAEGTMKLTIAVVLAGLVGCASHEYIYSPETTNAVTAQGLPAVTTAIPQEQPQGSVQVASYGLTTLRTPNGVVGVIHIRMTVSNDGDDTPWQLDPQQQILQIPNEGQSRALYVNSDVRAMPDVTIGRHQRRTLDFYFPLPDTIRGPSQLRSFELLWQVDTASRLVSSRTTFDRQSIDENAPDVYAENAYPYYWAGWGPYWWYDPFYPSIVFYHSHPFGRFGHGPVAIGRFGGHFVAHGGFHGGGFHGSHGGAVGHR